MAFIRRRLSSNGRYGPNYSHQLIESYREPGPGGRIRHRVLVNLGRFDNVAEALEDERGKLRQAAGCGDERLVE